ncbi:MAG: hypothetical protein CBE00_13030 [Planctomycetaceae bacterium TMED240]|nr:MAG: hypothetical protein CBE00_13030 [Planctomycetaceae bacterium TMED240]
MVTLEKLENRIKALEARHRALDKNIAEIYTEGYEDLAQMKKDKLALKDEINTLKQRRSDHGQEN